MDTSNRNAGSVDQSLVQRNHSYDLAYGEGWRRARDSGIAGYFGGANEALTCMSFRFDSRDHGSRLLGSPRFKLEVGAV